MFAAIANLFREAASPPTFEEVVELGKRSAAASRAANEAHDALSKAIKTRDADPEGFIRAQIAADVASEKARLACLWYERARYSLTDAVREGRVKLPPAS